MPKPKTPDPAPEVQLQIRLPAAVHQRLRMRAAKEGRALSAQARLFILDGLKSRREASQ